MTGLRQWKGEPLTGNLRLLRQWLRKLGCWLLFAVVLAEVVTLVWLVSVIRG
ncbi:TPA: hypothetical protein H2X16_004308 [Salmonella enterica]|nr:hypothetical protein [Salmonella enterica subsp. enterica serovar Bredeney]HAK8485161.1 hypothetical protein [Salmonella enterica]HAK8655333.1 hypothetical protein [Salmonella enterica]